MIPVPSPCNAPAMPQESEATRRYKARQRRREEVHREVAERGADAGRRGAKSPLPPSPAEVRAHARNFIARFQREFDALNGKGEA